eukprot:20694-Heterococcus_DN1.PRE.1
MVLLARARSLWMFAWGWVYSLFSDLHAREAAAMVPIRSFAALTLAAAAAAATAGANTASSTTDSKQQQERVTAPPSPATEAAKAHDSSNTTAAATATAGATAAAISNTAATAGAAASNLGGSASTASTTDSSSSSTKQRSSVSVSPLSALSGTASHTKRASCMMDETITLLFAGQCRKHGYGAHCVRHNARRRTCCDATQQDTSAATLSWALYLLSQPQHAAYRSALRQEVTAVCGGCSSSSSSSDSSSAAAGHVTAAHLGKLRLVDAVIKEVSANHLLLQCAASMLWHVFTFAVYSAPLVAWLRVKCILQKGRTRASVLTLATPAQRLYPVAPFVVRHITKDLICCTPALKAMHHMCRASVSCLSSFTGASACSLRCRSPPSAAKSRAMN